MINLVEPHSNVIPLTGGTPSATLTVSTRGLMALLNCGKPTAIKIGDSAGARISIGRKVLWNVKVIEQYLNRVAE